MKYYIITYGCQMNKSDSERIAFVLEKIGYRSALKAERADLVVVNACSVRQSAVDRIFGISEKLRKSKNGKIKTILTGCLLKNDKKKFNGRFDMILNIKDLSKWPRLLKTRASIRPNKFLSKRQPLNAFIPISNGCSNNCAYCVVPFTRGPLVCRDHREIIKETKKAIKRNIKEIWLLGQNVNDYHSPSGKSMDFSTLLKTIAGLPGDFSIRFISSNPKDFSDKLIDAIARNPKISKYLNLPVQSGDNKILKAMKRPYTVEQYKKLVEKIRKKIPNINLSTDAIVGFPGEDEENFQNTVKLFKIVRFNAAYVAKYSPRAGTASAELKDNIPQEEKERRWNILNDIVRNSKNKS